MGVREVVSTYAFLAASPKKLHCYDLNYSANIAHAHDVAFDHDVWLEYHIADVLTVEIEPTELLFIDTIHNYNQLDQELKLHADKVSKYIIIHDTSTFATVGEDGGEGIWKAIEDFLDRDETWEIKECLINNNGLTILQKV